MEEFSKREVIRICVIELFVLVFLAGIIAASVNTCNGNKKDDNDGFVSRYVRFTDNATAISYDVSNDFREIQIPYDGLEHTFSYAVLRTKDDTPLTQRGILEKSYKGDIAKRKGSYSYSVLINDCRETKTITLRVVIE